MRRYKYILFLLTLCHPLLGQWEMQLEDDAHLQITHEKAPIVTMDYAFWGKAWKWAPARFSLKGKHLSGEVPDLHLTFDGSVDQTSPASLEMTYSFTATANLTDIIGGGIVFHLQLNSPALHNTNTNSAPELLPDNRGWRWNISPNETLLVNFDPPMKTVYFERGNPSEIRCFPLHKHISPGKHTFTMTITLPDGGRLIPSTSARYATPHLENWHADALLWNDVPIDLSYLNEKPAGKRGFVQATENTLGDTLTFADGTPARFWGANLAAYALFSSHTQIEQQAKRIAQLGFNLIRIHHHDSMNWVTPTVIDKRYNDSRHLDMSAMDSIDYWIHCLKQEGVYVWLDLHVGRKFKENDDITIGFDEINRKDNSNGEVYGFCYYNTSIQHLMKEFQQQYLSHINLYTHLAYKDEPSIIGMLIVNENDLTHHFGNRMLRDKNNPIHNALFEKDAKNFSLQSQLPFHKVTQTWLPGPSKIYLNHREHLFNRDMIDHLRKLGVRVPLATTNSWASCPIYSLPALTAGDIIDVHNYGQEEALSANPRYSSNFISRIASSRVAGMPLSISEWNVPYPAVDRFTTPLYVASVACLQQWDAPMIYNYSQDHFNKPNRASKWSTYYDPALTAIMPAAAIAFRQEHIQPAKKHYVLQLDRTHTYYRTLDASTSATIRTLAETSKLSIGLPKIEELPWTRETSSSHLTLTDPDRDFIPANSTAIESDTGELKRNWVEGIQTIDTPKTQSASGWIGNKAIKLSDITFQITTNKATVAVTSLDNRPIADSDRILITAVARCIAPNNKLPFLSEPVEGFLHIRAKPGLICQVLKGDGTHPTILPTLPTQTTKEKEEEDGYKISLNTAGATHWFLLRDCAEINAPF